MTTRRVRRTPRLVVAGATALALGLAGCGQPLDVVPVGEPPAPESSTDQRQPPRDEAAPTERRTTPETRPEATPPSAGEPTTGPPATQAPTTEQPTSGPRASEETVLEAGHSGDAVEALQDDLRELGYWVGPVDGTFGELTEQAVLAFQGWMGLDRDGRVGQATRAALQDATRPEPDRTGDLIEIHLDKQVLLVVQDGRAVTALHVSTGAEEHYVQPSGREAYSDTPTGDWEISWRIDGWRESQLGTLWRPVYFHERGIAIHGHPEVPAEPASHGCVRVSMDAMDMLWGHGHVTEGTPVVVR